MNLLWKNILKRDNLKPGGFTFLWPDNREALKRFQLNYFLFA